MTPDEAINGLVDRITELDELVELRNRQIGDLVRKSEEDADRIAELERVIDACVAHLEASEQDGVAAITVLQMLEGVREKSAINPSTDIAQPLAVTEEPMTEANQIPVGLCDEIGILLATVDLPPAARATLKRCRASLGAQPPAVTDEQIAMICEAIRKAGMALISKEHALLMLEAQQLMGGSVNRKVMEDELREAIAALQGEGEKG